MVYHNRIHNSIPYLSLQVEPKPVHGGMSLYVRGRTHPPYVRGRTHPPEGCRRVKETHAIPLISKESQGRLGCR